MWCIFKEFSFLFNATQDRKVHCALSFQISWIRKSFERSSFKLHNPVVSHVPIPNKREVSCRFLCLLRPYFPLCLLQPALRAGNCKNFLINWTWNLEKSWNWNFLRPWSFKVALLGVYSIIYILYQFFWLISLWGQSQTKLMQNYR